MSIQKSEEYCERIIYNWDLSHKNKYIIMCPQKRETKCVKIICIAQIRLKTGDFGSDNILFRFCNEGSTEHTN